MATEKRQRYGVRPRPYGLWPFIVWDYKEQRRVAHHTTRGAAEETAQALNEKGAVDAA